MTFAAPLPAVTSEILSVLRAAGRPLRTAEIVAALDLPTEAARGVSRVLQTLRGARQIEQHGRAGRVAWSTSAPRPHVVAEFRESQAAHARAIEDAERRLLLGLVERHPGRTAAELARMRQPLHTLLVDPVRRRLAELPVEEREGRWYRRGGGA